MNTEKNIPEMFINRVRRFRTRSAYLVKTDGSYRPISWDELLATVCSVAFGLAQLGIRKDDKVGIISESRIEWVYTDLAILSLGAITVPVFPTYSRRDVEYIIVHSEARAIVVSDVRQGMKVNRLKEKHGDLLTIISFDALPETIPSITLSGVMQRGAKDAEQSRNSFFSKIRRINEDDVATIIYTSGTTGPPKGVMLTHRNFLSNCAAAGRAINVQEGDIALSILPFSHVFERLAGYYLHMYLGVVVAFAENLTTLLANLKEVRPHVANFVPRIFEKFYRRLLGKVSSSSRRKQKIFYWALDVGKQYYVIKLKKQKPSIILWSAYILAKILVYNKVRKQFGGRLKFLISGGAKLSRDIARFFYAANVLILEGYGLTETAPVISVNRTDNFRFGMVGIPLDNLMVKIAQDGEILVKGPSIMKGYFKDEEATHRVIRDGWLHTGDIGSLDDQGFLKITDRKKDIIVTSAGKNVAPQNIENLLNADQFINQVFVCGDGEKYLSALIVPDFEQLEYFARTHGVAYASRDALIEKKEIFCLMRERIEEHNKEMADYERIKSFSLLKEEFTVEKGELTPTMKIKRNVVAFRYKNMINAMYRR